MSWKPGTTVLVTGFGPFGEHKVNISWEVAKYLKTLNLESSGIQLITEEIPVVYSIVSNEVPALWKKHKPKLVIHMGVTGTASEMSLELLAYKKGYDKIDTLGKLPEKGSANGVKDVIRTTLNLKNVCDYLSNSIEHRVPIKVSSNAGRYLCEFTYYTSLNIDNTKVVFVHIPDFNKGFTVKEIALMVKEIVFMLLTQITNLPIKSGEEQYEADDGETAEGEA